MSEDKERIAKLEVQVQTLADDLKEERKVVKELKQKVDTAETWGRVVVWLTLVIGGIVSQIETVLGWFRR